MNRVLLSPSNSHCFNRCCLILAFVFFWNPCNCFCFLWITIAETKTIFSSILFVSFLSCSSLWGSTLNSSNVSWQLVCVFEESTMACFVTANIYVAEFVMKVANPRPGHSEQNNSSGINLERLFRATFDVQFLIYVKSFIKTFRNEYSSQNKKRIRIVVLLVIRQTY